MPISHKKSTIFVSALSTALLAVGGISYAAVSNSQKTNQALVQNNIEKVLSGRVNQYELFLRSMPPSMSYTDQDVLRSKVDVYADHVQSAIDRLNSGAELSEVLSDSSIHEEGMMIGLQTGLLRIAHSKEVASSSHSVSRSRSSVVINEKISPSFIPDNASSNVHSRLFHSIVSAQSVDELMVIQDALLGRTHHTVASNVSKKSLTGRNLSRILLPKIQKPSLTQATSSVGQATTTENVPVGEIEVSLTSTSTPESGTSSPVISDSASTTAATSMPGSVNLDVIGNGSSTPATLASSTQSVEAKTPTDSMTSESSPNSADSGDPHQ